MTEHNRFVPHFFGDHTPELENQSCCEESRTSDGQDLGRWTRMTEVL